MSIITSGNRPMTASDKHVRDALRKAIDRGALDPESLARTRFDHGFYVFEPILWDLSETVGTSNTLSVDSLDKFLVLLGILSGGNGWLSVTGLRRSFSARYPENKRRLENLSSGVRTGDEHKMRDVVNSALWETWE